MDHLNSVITLISTTSTQARLLSTEYASELRGKLIPKMLKDEMVEVSIFNVPPQKPGDLKITNELATFSMKDVWYVAISQVYHSDITIASAVPDLTGILKKN